MAKKEPKSLFRRLTTLFRSSPVVRKKVRGYDTTASTADGTKSSGALLFQKSLSPTYATITANAYNLSERLMRYQDFQEMELTAEISAALDLWADEVCLSKDSIVPLLDGTRPTALELFESGKEDFWVYSYDVATGNIVPGQAKRVVKTGKKLVYRVNLDDGTYLRLTGNHRVLMSNGTYVPVEQLEAGDSLRSLYTKLSSFNNDDYIDGYEQVLTSTCWKYTHRMVAEHMQPHLKGVIHHCDINKRNNEPGNLRFMSRKDHQEIHRQINSSRWKNPAFADKMKRVFSESAKKSHSIPGFTARCLAHCQSALASYDQETRKYVFGRRGQQNGMYANGNAIAADRNGRWNSTYVRTVTRDQILGWIFSGRSAQSVCEELPIRFKDLHRCMQAAGIKKWAQKHAVEHEPIFNRFSEWRRLQPADVDLKRCFSKACSFAGVTRNQAYYALLAKGYKTWGDFIDKTNHLVVSVVAECEEDVFDLEVKEWHNFAVTAKQGSDSYVFVHNCAQDDKGRILHVFSDNERIQELLEDLFDNVINFEFNGRSWVRNLCKFGDTAVYIDVSPERGVVNAFPIPINELEREENFDPNDPFAVRYRWITLGNRILENWEVAHFRLLGNDMFLPYGTSVIDAARRIWRQLILIEDAMLVYRIVRAPERRVFYVDVGNMPPENIPMYVEEQRKRLRTSQVIDNATARVDLRYNPLSIDEDYVIPVRGQETGTKIDTLSGGQNTAAVEDVAYIQKKLFAALKIPRAYLGFDDALSSKASLAQIDIRFSRSVQIIQKTVLAELNKIAVIHLYSHGFSNDDLQNFTLRLSNPSTVAQQQKLELWRSKFEIGGSLPEGMGSKRFVQREIWGLSDVEIDSINKERLKEKTIDDTIESGGGDELGGGGGGADAGGVDLFGGGEDAGPAEEPAGETPPEENAGEEPEEDEPGLDLLTSGDDPGDKPIIPNDRLRHSLYNRSRRRHHGASKTHMPDFAKMTAAERDVGKHHDADTFRALVSDPFGESNHVQFYPLKRRGLSADLLSTLRGLESHRRHNGVLTEGIDQHDVVDVDIDVDDND